MLDADVDPELCNGAKHLVARTFKLVAKQPATAERLDKFSGALSSEFVTYRVRDCYRPFLQKTRHIFRMSSNTHLNLAGELVTLDRTYMTYHVVGLL